jgi:hypothetical protein
MLYHATACLSTTDGTGAAQEADERERAVFKRVCKLMARAVHPGTPPEEAEVSMRLARAQMVTHHLEEAAVLRQLRADADGRVAPEGGMCRVTLVRYVEGTHQRFWWESTAPVPTVPNDGGGGNGSGNGSGSCSGSDSCSDSGSDSEYDAHGKQKRPRTQARIHLDRYAIAVANAMCKFACVKYYSTRRRLDTSLFFFGLKAQACIAAYQFQVAINTATHHAVQLGNKATATERVRSANAKRANAFMTVTVPRTMQADYVRGFARGLDEKVAMMRAASVGGVGGVGGGSNGIKDEGGGMPPPPGAIALGVSLKVEHGMAAAAAAAAEAAAPCPWKRLKEMKFDETELERLRTEFLHEKCRGSVTVRGRSSRPYLLQWLHFSLWNALTQGGKDLHADKQPKEVLLFALRCIKFWRTAKACLGPLPYELRVIAGAEDGERGAQARLQQLPIFPAAVMCRWLAGGARGHRPHGLRPRRYRPRRHRRRRRHLAVRGGRTVRAGGEGQGQSGA